MRDTLAHRGPDASGHVLKGNVGLGHRRLSIIDLSMGEQPMHNEDGSIWVIFNGEIYNFVELRRMLEGNGHVFSTKSDTEVLLHLYEEKGEQMLAELNGMFAFCIWDTKRKRLFLARDRAGKKPLFYSLVREAFVFGSEPKALLCCPWVGREVDPLSLSKYLTYEYIPAPNSIFRDIKKLPPGHYAVYDTETGGLMVHKYWDIPISDDAIALKSEQEYAEELVSRLRESVRIRLRSDVPVGIFLSGGIDSSAIVALASELNSSVKTFTIGFKEASFDESKYASAVARHFGTEHHHEVLDIKKSSSLLPEIAGVLDEPLGDASIIPTFLLSRFVAKEVKVALGGDGCDELFAGYPTFPALKLINYYNILPKEVRAVIHRLAAKLPVSHKNISFDFKVKQLLRGAGVSSEIMFFYWMGSFTDMEKRHLLAPKLLETVQNENTFEDALHYLKDSNLHKTLERILYLSFKCYLQDDILVKVDRASMANSLEVRAPFLDFQFVEFAAHLPTFYKLNRLTMKYLVKKAFSGMLPDSIRNRRKKGFGIPIAEWIHSDMRPLILEYLDEARIRREGFFNALYVKELIAEHLSFKKDNRKLLWTLLVFQMWKERWLER